MSIGKLILYPTDPETAPPAAQALSNSLHLLGLIGQPLGTDANGFLAGEHFLQLISFVGCSPAVCLNPQEERTTGLCHLSILGPFDSPQLLFSQDCRPPRCPSCQQSLPNWKEFADKREIVCKRCGASQQGGDITWGRRAGYGRIFIEIHNIFPGEAQPVAGLLNQLETETGLSWDYFFTASNQ